MTKGPRVNNELAVALLLLTTHSISRAIVQGGIWIAVSEAITICIGVLFFRLAIWLPYKTEAGFTSLAIRLQRMRQASRQEVDAKRGAGDAKRASGDSDS